MFTRPLNRGCYQPRSRCMFSFTFTQIHLRIDMLSHALQKKKKQQNKEPLFEPSCTRIHASFSQSGPGEGHAFVSRCQDAGVCSCASRFTRFILFSRGGPFVCGPVSFQSALAFLPPPRRGRWCAYGVTGDGSQKSTNALDAAAMHQLNL